MDFSNKSQVNFFFEKSFNDANNSGDKIGVLIEYNSKSDIDKEEILKTINSLSEYMNNEFNVSSNNAIDIVSNFRRITNNIEENYFHVSINRDYISGGCKDQAVTYSNGIVKSCIAYKNTGANSIDICNLGNGININIKRDGLYLEKEIINEEFEELYSIVFTLSNMVKDNDEVLSNRNQMKLIL